MPATIYPSDLSISSCSPVLPPPHSPTPPPHPQLSPHWLFFLGQLLSLSFLPPPIFSSFESPFALPQQSLLSQLSLLSTCPVAAPAHLVPPKAPQKPVGPLIQLGAQLGATPQLQGSLPSPEGIGSPEPASLTGFCGSHGHSKLLAGGYWGEEGRGGEGS